jgi:low temperature requirement protein LtrA
MDAQPTEREQRVTPLELFFDLVVVFAITQVTQFMSHDLTRRGIGHGVLVLAAIWWAWTGYAWLTNALEPEEGQVRAGMFGAMAAMLLVALAVPGAFGADEVGAVRGGLPARASAQPRARCDRRQARPRPSFP